MWLLAWDLTVLLRPLVVVQVLLVLQEVLRRLVLDFSCLFVPEVVHSPQ